MGAEVLVPIAMLGGWLGTVAASHKDVVEDMKKQQDDTIEADKKERSNRKAKEIERQNKISINNKKTKEGIGSIASGEAKSNFNNSNVSMNNATGNKKFNNSNNNFGNQNNKLQGQ